MPQQLIHKPADDGSNNGRQKYIAQYFAHGHIFFLNRFFHIPVFHMFHAEREPYQCDSHTHACSGKGIAPAVVVAHIGSNEIAYKGAYIDTHVEYIVSHVFTGLQVWPVIYITKHGAYIRLKKSIAYYDHQQGNVERRITRYGKGIVACSEK